MAAKKPKQSEFAVSMPATDYKTSTFFNRFHIEPVGPHFLIQFGLIHNGEILSSYSVLLEAETRQQSMEGMLKYLGEAGAPSEGIADWVPAKSSVPPDARRLDVSNYVQISRVGDIGEIRFGLFSIGAGLDRVRREASKVEINASALALLRCPLDLQKHLLIQLYETDAGH